MSGDNNTETVGEFGGRSIREEQKELRMRARAIQQRWPISEADRADTIAALLEAMKTATKPRDIVTAARGILAAEAQNQQDEHKLVDVSLNARNARISSIAAELGIDESVIRLATAEANRDVGSDGGGTVGQ